MKLLLGVLREKCCLCQIVYRVQFIHDKVKSMDTLQFKLAVHVESLEKLAAVK